MGAAYLLRRLVGPGRVDARFVVGPAGRGCANTSPPRGIFSAARPMLCMLLINAKPTRWPARRLRPVLLALGLVAEGEDRRLDAVLQGELGENAADVGLDGLLADRQIPGDLPVAVTAGDQPEYFPLAR